MKNIKSKILEYFFTYPTARKRLREIERELKLPFPSVVRYCKELQDEGYLQLISVGSVKFYTTNRQDKTFLLEKMLYNIRQLHSSGLIEFLKQELSNPVIILFGSFSRGEDIESSDIDLYVETLSKKKLNLENYEKKIRRNIQIFRHTNIKEVKNIHLANNIINGHVLNKQVEVFN